MVTPDCEIGEQRERQAEGNVDGLRRDLSVRGYLSNRLGQNTWDIRAQHRFAARHLHAAALPGHLLATIHLVLCQMPVRQEARNLGRESPNNEYRHDGDAKQPGHAQSIHCGVKSVLGSNE